MTEKPLTASMLADALGCFWNASIGAAHRRGDGIEIADIMSEGMQAVATRLIEITEAQDAVAAETATGFDLSGSKVADSLINEITLNTLGGWPDFKSQSWACKVVKAVLLAQESANAPDLSTIPDGWWLYGLFHNHTPIKYKEDQHRPLTMQDHGKEPWEAKLQCYAGGKLTVGSGPTPAAALRNAIMEVELRWLDPERDSEEG